MQLQPGFAFAVIAVFAGLLAGCGESRLSPTSPSLTASRASDDAPRSAARFTPRRVDDDGDGYEDPEPGPADPAMPSPIPGEVPPPEGIPAPEGMPPAPVQLTINIVGSFGSLAYAPNPLQGTVGNTIVWTNNDFVLHDIVLDDGTPVGNVAPGQSTVPITLNAPTVSYHCTIHPSMTGQIVPVPLPTGEPVPGDPSQVPLPDPSAPAPPAPSDPYDDGYGDGDGYDYDYY